MNRQTINIFGSLYTNFNVSFWHYILLYESLMLAPNMLYSVCK